jgi:septum formation protein
MTGNTTRLVLASTSRYRAELLRRLGVEFESCAPGTDETPVAGESPPARARRVAIAQAEGAPRKRRGTGGMG